MDYYRILEIAPDASPDDIRRAYRDRAKERHPDRISGGEDAMILLNRAYETLKDPDRRRAYDAQRRPTPRPVPKVVDPIQFLRLFRPLDTQLQAALDALGAAIAEVAYDLFDDRAVAQFGLAVNRTRTRLDEAIRSLNDLEWPSPWLSALNLYSQGLRQVEDALEDFEVFTRSYDCDRLIDGKAILAGARELLVEARYGLGEG